MNTFFEPGKIEIISSHEVVAKDDELDYWTDHLTLSSEELQALIDGKVLVIPGNTTTLFIRAGSE